jgi:large subunit ribosomal protein L21
MRKLTFLILGVLIGLLAIEYLMEREGREYKRAVEPVAPTPRKKAIQPEMTAASQTGRWQGTDETPGSQSRDPLTHINGIGPAFEKALNDIGIYTFAQLANQDVDDLASRLRARITAERIRRDHWIEQAKFLSEQ